MKKLLILFFMLFSLFLIGYSQNKIPKNIKQAIICLDKNSSDSLKKEIATLSDKELEKFNYPYGNYKTIFDWIDEKGSRLSKYLKKHGIKKQKEVVVLSAFQNFLNKGYFKINDFLIPYQLKEKRWKYEDSNKYTIDTIRGFYIPIDLNDCMITLDKILPDTTKEKIKKQSQNDFVWNSYSSGLGLWMRNNWGLWRGSRLSKYLYDNGLSEPEGMSVFIMSNYYYHLKNPDYDVINSIESVRQKYYAQKNRMDSLRRMRFSRYKIGDTVLYGYRLGYVSKSQEEADINKSCIATGIIKQTDTTNFLLKIQLIKCCDKRGIIYSQKNDDGFFNDKYYKKVRSIKEKKLKIKRMGADKEKWFKPLEWYKINS